MESFEKSKQKSVEARIKKVFEVLKLPEFFVADIIKGMVLIKEGVKPLYLTEIPLDSVELFLDNQEVFDGLIEELLIALRDYGIEASRVWQYESGGYVFQNIVLGNDMKEIYEFMDVYQKRLLDKDTDAEIDRKFGLMMGYPETAVKAFVGDPGYTKITSDDLDEEIQNQEYMAFGNLTFSKEHFEEELDVVKKWAEVVKKKAPKVYDIIVTRYLENLEAQKK